MLLWLTASMLIVLALLIACVSYLWHQPDWLLPKLNQYLTPYHIRFDALSWHIADNRTLDIPQLAFDYAGNSLRFDAISLSLTQPMTLSRLWQWYQLPTNEQRYQQISQAIATIRYQHANIAVPVAQLLPSQSTEPLWLPIVGHLPALDFGDTRITLQGTAPIAGIHLANLTLSEQGKFHSQLTTIDDTAATLLALDGELPTKDLNTAVWQLQASLTLSTLYQLQDTLNQQAATTALIDAYPWLAPDWLMGAARATGELSAGLRLTLKDGGVNGQLCWQHPGIAFDAAAASMLEIAGNSESTDHCPQGAMLLRYRNQGNDSYASLAPFSLALQLTAEQRQAWTQQLALDTAKQAQLDALLTRVQQQIQIPKDNVAANAPAEQALGMSLMAEQGLTLKSDGTHYQAQLPKLILTPTLFDWFTSSDSKLALTLTNSELNLPVAASVNEFNASGQWQLGLALPRGINAMDTHWSAQSQMLNIMLLGDARWDGSSQLGKLTISPQSNIKLSQLMARFAGNSVSASAFSATQTQAANIEWQHGTFTLSLPQTHNQVQQLQGVFAPYQFSVKQVDLQLPAVSSLTLTTKQPLWPQLMQQQLDSQLSINAAQPHVAQRKKTLLGANEQSLLNLRSVQLAQQLHWHNSVLNSDEIWHIDDVTLASQHKLTPQKEGYQLSATWQMQTSLASLQQIAAKNLQWQPDWQLTGNSKLTAKVDLHQQPQQFSLNVAVAPEISDASGHYQQMPFDGLTLSADCRYQLKVAPKMLDASRVGCQQFSLTANSFNPGILVTNIDVTGNGDFTPAAPNHVSDSWLLPGFSDAQLHLNASANALQGLLTIPDFNFDLSGESHGFVLVRGMDIEQLLQQHPQQGITATGVFDGVLPMAIKARRISITGGHLAARDPGLIEVHNTPTIEQMRTSQPYLDYVLNFMQRLQYQEILGQLDMAENGDAHIQLSIKGHGQGIERPVHLNYSHEENLLQLLQSLTVGDRLQTGLEASMQ
ncbi:hypothetical protein HR45_14865 [Shewanella mangrovi]|uniref:Uncharacterized protein n=2 Tax=Shewanella mangrovi TaxID=1515746 RepID=A0A094JW99_9GAMM|nr:hypothetical protein HR45_14865 [Shewanella mangrovi]